ncbi:MAG TPA: winged helix-turn-helix domain-containing protein [Methanomassiliicoccales archaeon]|nr:winged helix-turn-helix domain-containing protein [Methanomassiliicoccales archaeon]
MKEMGVEQLKVLSDPNRLAILSLLTIREMTTTAISNLLGLSVQNAQYHMKKLLEAGLIVPTRTELVGNLVEKYYRSAFEPGIMGDAAGAGSVDIAERLNIVFAALGAIKGILNRGIRLMDERKEYFMNVAERPNYPFGANYVILPVSAPAVEDAETLMSELNDRLKGLSDKHPEEGKPKFAVLYAVFPFE